MTTLTKATPAQLFQEIRKRLKNEITKEELTEALWEHMEPSGQQIADAAEDHDLRLMTEDEIDDEVEARMTGTELFKIVTRLAYLENTSTIRNWNELQREARHQLSTGYGQFHQMGL
jgi:hypothetical protein